MVPPFVMCMEDGPATWIIQLYMYVGQKDLSKGASVLSRNGRLKHGASSCSSSCPTLRSDRRRSIYQRLGHRPLGGDARSDNGERSPNSEAQTDAVGAFTFIRIEDGAGARLTRTSSISSRPRSGAAHNLLGRLYEVNFEKANILGSTTITLIYNGDAVAAAGGETAFAPDNVDTNENYLMICEDGTAQSRPDIRRAGPRSQHLALRPEKSPSRSHPRG